MAELAKPYDAEFKTAIGLLQGSRYANRNGQPNSQKVIRPASKRIHLSVIDASACWMINIRESSNGPINSLTRVSIGMQQKRNRQAEMPTSSGLQADKN